MKILRRTRSQIVVDVMSSLQAMVQQQSKSPIRLTPDNKHIFDHLMQRTFSSPAEFKRAANEAFKITRGSFPKETAMLRGWTEEEWSQHCDWMSTRGSNKTSEQNREGSNFCIEYWVKRGLSETEAKEQISRRQAELNARISPENRKSHFQIKYWMEKGFSGEEAHQIVSDNARRYSPRCGEHWLSKGYSESEAIEKVKDAQALSVEKFIEWYGEEVGPAKWESWKQHPNRIIASRANLLKIRSTYSKSSQVLFDMISKVYVGDIYYATWHREDMVKYTCKEYVLKCADGSWVRPDFLDLNKKRIIEFDGEYWHQLMKESGSDAARDLKITTQGFEILRVWENDFKKTPTEVLEKCLKFLNK